MSFTRLPSETTEQWLEQRREYVTASEIYDLATSPSSWARIRAEKETGERKFHGNAVTRWGHEREPEIARFVRLFVDSSIVPNDDLFVLDGTHLAATPDMVSENLADGCEMIGELKTAGTQIIRPEWEYDPEEPTKVHRTMPVGFPKPRYWSQVQYQLLVMGAEVCVFACEVRDEYEYGFAPGDTRVMLIGPDLDRQAVLRDIAERFLAGDDPADATPAELESLALSILDMQEDVKDLQEQIKVAKKRIREAVGDEPGTYPTDVANVIVSAAGKSHGVNLEALKEEHPDIVALYPKITPRSGSVKVLPVNREEATA